jgi:hypothetical protein
MQPNGCATSLLPATSHRATWTSATYGTLPPMTSRPTRKSTSAPALESGPAFSVQTDGTIRDQSGQLRSLASLSARQAKDLGLLTSGTSGQPGITLSESDSLQSSLANSLHRLSDAGGWSLFKLTWKLQAMPSGRSQPVLRGSARRPGEATISVTGNTGVLDGWATPTSRDHKDGASVGTVEVNSLLGREVWLASWNTPRATDGSNGGPNQAGGALSHDVSLAAWPTSTARDGSGGRTTKTKGGGSKYLDREVRLAGWATPITEDKNETLEAFRARQAKVLVKHPDKGMGVPLSIQALTSSTAPTKSGGRLRSGHSRWLMRIPIEWENCAPTETPSTLRKRKPSWPPSLSANPVDVSDLC